MSQATTVATALANEMAGWDILPRVVVGTVGLAGRRHIAYEFGQKIDDVKVGDDIGLADYMEAISGKDPPFLDDGKMSFIRFKHMCQTWPTADPIRLSFFERMWAARANDKRSCVADIIPMHELYADGRMMWMANMVGDVFHSGPVLSWTMLRLSMGGMRDIDVDESVRHLIKDYTTDGLKFRVTQLTGPTLDWRFPRGVLLLNQVFREYAVYRNELLRIAKQTIEEAFPNATNRMDNPVFQIIASYHSALPQHLFADLNYQECPSEFRHLMEGESLQTTTSTIFPQYVQNVTDPTVRTVLVKGTTSLAESIVLEMAKTCHVVWCGLDEERGRRWLAELSPRLVFMRMDVTDADDFREVGIETKSRGFGPIECIIDTSGKGAEFKYVPKPEPTTVHDCYAAAGYNVNATQNQMSILRNSALFDEHTGQPTYNIGVPFFKDFRTATDYLRKHAVRLLLSDDYATARSLDVRLAKGECGIGMEFFRACAEHQFTDPFPIDFAVLQPRNAYSPFSTYSGLGYFNHTPSAFGNRADPPLQVGDALVWDYPTLPPVSPEERARRKQMALVFGRPTLQEDQKVRVQIDYNDMSLDQIPELITCRSAPLTQRIYEPPIRKPSQIEAARRAGVPLVDNRPIETYEKDQRGEEWLVDRKYPSTVARKKKTVWEKLADEKTAPSATAAPVDPSALCTDVNCKKRQVAVRCTSCKVVFYCNRKCHRANWAAQHKLICSAATATSSS